MATAQLAIRDRTLSARRCQDDGHTRAEHQTGAVGVGQEAQQLGEDVARFEIRREQNVGIAGDLGANSLCLGGLLADRIVESQRAVEKAAGDLPAVGHLAQSRGVQGRRHLRIHRFNGGENGHFRLLPGQGRWPDRWRSGRCRPCPPASVRC